MIISRDVIFDEGAQWQWTEDTPQQQNQILPPNSQNEVQTQSPNTISPNSPSSNTSPQSPSSPPSPRTTSTPQSPQTLTPNSSEQNQTQQVQRSQRDRRPPTYLKDYQCGQAMMALFASEPQTYHEAAQYKLPVYQLDVKSTFLNGELEEEVYVEQPQGYLIEGREDKVYRLRKALYGLK